MPRAADPAVRDRLVAAAADLLAGDEEVTLRKVAAAADTSTMAVYTHFDGMPGLWFAVRERGFGLLADRLAALPATADPVADLVASGRAYVDLGVAEPALYRSLFDVRRSAPQPRTAAMTFAVLVGGVERARAAGRLHRGTDLMDAATRLWAMTHGVVSLVIGGALPPDATHQHLPSMYGAQLRAWGDGPRKAATSVARGWGATAEL